MIRAATLALALSAAATPVLAEGWSITVLDGQISSGACMDQGRSVLNRYMFAHGGGSTGADSWSLYGYDLEPGLQDVVIMCPSSGGNVMAILVVQSESESDDRGWAAQTLIDYWNEY